jgi:hypothetical protein
MIARLRFACLLGAISLMVACNSEETSKPATPVEVQKDPVSFEIMASWGSDVFRQYSVYADVSKVDGTTAFRELEKFAQMTCREKVGCIFLFWDVREKAARSMSMDKDEMNSLTAQYSINRKMGLNDFSCHGFGDPSLRCAKW